MGVSSLSFFHPLIQQWFRERIGTPTDVQEQSWRSIRQGEHVLLTAPTGSGKTLAAFLWAINQLVSGVWSGGAVRVLYVSPMKALNNDVHRNLKQPLQEIGRFFQEAGEDFPAIRVVTRSGDTSQSERQRMYRKPPEILITTPESLNILVTSKSGRALFSGLSAVILDEIHAVVPEKRGTHLITAVDRLVLLSGEFQRIALSATVHPLETVAGFVGGFRLLPGGHYEKRQVTIIRSDMVKQLDLQVAMPPDALDDTTDTGWWPALTREFRKIIAAGNATLFFANSRRFAEKITRLINENEEEDLVYSHHGSLSREIRLEVEQKLKSGEIKAIVATNSLELGIDIGHLDQVVMVESTGSVAAAIQRIGRAGHRVNETSQGLLFPLHGKDFVHSAVLARAVCERAIEEVRPVENPLDILAQVILAMVVAEKWEIDDLFSVIRTSYPYRDLSRHHFDLVLSMLAGRYGESKIRELKGRVRLDAFDNTVEARDGTAFLLYTGGGTIPDRGTYTMRHQETGARLGELDEEFVWERRLGETFTLGAQIWRIRKITHNDVEVLPVAQSHNIIPFWKGEGLDRQFHLSARIGEFLEEIWESLENPAVIDTLEDEYHLERQAAEYLYSYLLRQKEVTGGELPHRHNLVIEHFDDPLNSSDSKQVILHTLWGNPVNYPFALALSAAWQEKHDYPLQVFADNDCILLMLPHRFSGDDLLSLVNCDNLEGLLRRKLEQSGYFGAHFRENAGRALLLPRVSIKKRMPLWLNRLRAKKLFEAVAGYEDFPILLETWRECFQDKFDLPHLKLLLDELDSGKIKVTEVITRTPSPFADSVIWRRTNTLMYEDDTPDGAIRSSLSDTLLRDLVFTSQLRPKIEPEIIELFLGKIQRTQEGYAPLQPADLIVWIEERLLIPEDEWRELLCATVRDSGLNEADILKGICNRVVRIRLPNAEIDFISAIVRLPFLATSLGLHEHDLVIKPLAEGQQAETLVSRAFSSYRRKKEEDEPAELSLFLANWLAYYGPLPLETVNNIFGLSGQRIADAITELQQAEQLVLDTFTDGARETEVCIPDNLEILLRMMRRARRPAFTPLPCEKLPLFLASQQGLTETEEDSIEQLQLSLDALFGYPAPCAAWEEYIFPTRIRPYSQAHLDSLLQSVDLVWYGCGSQKISFAFVEDLDLYLNGQGRSTETEEQISRLFPDPRGKYTFFDLQTFSQLESGDLAERIWSLVWRGRLSNDAYSVLRQGIQHKFKPVSVANREIQARRGGFSRWKASRPLAGPFYILPSDASRTRSDGIAEQEKGKDRVRQLLLRYGIIFRDLLAREIPLLQWKNVYKTLRLMELSGEILSGCFFTDIQGPQFISLAAYRRLQHPLDEEKIFWLNGCDPASLCGLGPERLRQQLPRRVASSFLVYHGSRLCVVLLRNGKEIVIHVAPGHPLLDQYLSICKDLLTREFKPLKRIAVEKVNGVAVLRSEYYEDLVQFGFRASHRGLVLS